MFSPHDNCMSLLVYVVGCDVSVFCDFFKICVCFIFGILHNQMLYKIKKKNNNNINNILLDVDSTIDH